jgi:hypothetical protein
VSYSQSFDTLTFMSYNLLFYGESTSFCDNGNNNVGSKDIYLKKIVKHADPDFLVVNEMGASSVYLKRILNNALNVDGVSKYNSCSIQSNSSSIINGLFFNREKIGLKSRDKVEEALNGSNLVRVIDVNTFYIKDPELEKGADTTFFHVAAAHLKAGNSSSDASARGLAAEALMDHFVTNTSSEYLFLCGDLNLYDSDETAYQELLNSGHGDHRLYDPINEAGDWNNNSSFSGIHSQSTRSSSTNGGCFSGGGMDDRFDFILASGAVIQDTGSITYIPGTYYALGQDGDHFNQALNQGSNNAAPSAVIAALYEMSDHLPIVADFKIRLHETSVDTLDTADTVSAVAVIQIPLAKVWTQRSELRVESYASNSRIDLIDQMGNTVFTRLLGKGYNVFNAATIPPGIYVAHIQHRDDHQFERVLILR